MSTLAASPTSLTALTVVRCVVQPSRAAEPSKHWRMYGLVPPVDVTTSDGSRVMFIAGELVSRGDELMIGATVQASVQYQGLSKPIFAYSDRSLRAQIQRLAQQYQHVLYDRAFDVAASLAALVRTAMPFEVQTMPLPTAGLIRLAMESEDPLADEAEPPEPSLSDSPPASA